MAAAEVMQMKHEDEFGFSCPSAPPPSPEIPMKRNFFSCVNLTMDSSRISSYHRRQDDIDMDPDELLFNSSSNSSFNSSFNSSRESFPVSYQLPNFNVGDLNITHPTSTTTATPGLSIPYCDHQSETLLPARMGQIQISGSPTKKIILCTDSQSLSFGSDSCGSLITSEIPMSSDVVQPSSSPPHSPARKRKISAHRSQEGNFSFSPSPSSTIDMEQDDLEISEKKRCVLSDEHSSFNVVKHTQLMRRRNAICNPQPPLHMFRRDLSPVPDVGGVFHASFNMEDSKPPTRKTSDCPVYGQFLNVDNNSMDTSSGPTFSRSL